MSNLTGKQKKFVAEYLNGANFNATLAAKLAGYKATSKHSFEAIGSENLQRPAIKAAIDSYFAAATVSAEETLQELAKLARGNSKDKIRALALLSQHHGLLDGTWAKRNGGNELTIRVEYEKGWNAAIGAVEQDVKEFNLNIAKSNNAKWALWAELMVKYNEDKTAIKALKELKAGLQGLLEKENERLGAPISDEEKKFLDELDQRFEPKPAEVEVIPPARRLQPAAVERLMQETEPERKENPEPSTPIEPEIVEPENPEPEPPPKPHAVITISGSGQSEPSYYQQRTCGHGYKGACSLCNHYGFR